MKALRFFSIAMIATLFFTSCIDEGIRPAGETTTIDYEFADFTAINVSDAFNVEIVQDAIDPHVSITIDIILTQYLDVYVRNNRLYIGLEDHIYARGNAVQLGTIYIAGPLNDIKASGASQLIIEETMKIEDLDIELSGASQLTGVVNVTSLDVEVSGASTLSLEGKALYYRVDASGASSARGYELISNHADIEVSGASSCMLSVADALSVEASGASNVRYKGDPTILRKELSGASNLIHIE